MSNICLLSNINIYQIRNHGVGDEVIDEVWDDTRAFFDLPVADKMGPNNELLMTDDFPYGYSPYGGEKLAKGQIDVDGEAIDKGGNASEGDAAGVKKAAGDMKEMFATGPYLPEAMMPLPRYPASPSRMAASWRHYFEAMEGLSASLMQGFALSLDLEEKWFEAKVTRHASSLRALNYPSTLEGGKAVAPAVPGQMRASAHTDYGVLTILRSGGPGLQVKLRDGEWHDVPFLPGAFVINLGDLMSRWTNDKWRSTPHRVINPLVPKSIPASTEGGGGGGNRRQSIAYFCNLNMDAHVEVIPTCVSEENPSKYPPTKAGDHLMAKHSASTRGILDDSWMKDMVK